MYSTAMPESASSHPRVFRTAFRALQSFVNMNGHTIVVAGLLLTIPVLPGAPPASAAPPPYEEVKGWPSLPPGIQLGETAGVAVDRDGHVLVFHRPGRGFEPNATTKLTDPTVLEIDPNTGKLISSWGSL